MSNLVFFYSLQNILLLLLIDFDLPILIIDTKNPPTAYLVMYKLIT